MFLRFGPLALLSSRQAKPGMKRAHGSDRSEALAEVLLGVRMPPGVICRRIVTST
jgi:hypothetical protein